MRGAGYKGGNIYKGLRKELCVGATSISISTYQVLDDLGIPLLQVAEEGGHAHGAESEKAIAAATRPERQLPVLPASEASVCTGVIRERR